MLTTNSIQSPLAYFGNRCGHLEDVMGIIKKGREKPYEKFYDLFAGSASLSLTAIEHEVANNYVINDAYPPLADFWKTVEGNPEELTLKYSLLLEKYKNAKENQQEAYSRIQAAYHRALKKPLSAVNRVKQSARFAFLINHAEHGVPLLNQEQKLVSSCISQIGELPIDKTFKENVYRTHQLFQKNQGRISFTAKSFTEFAASINKEHLVLLDPPYPDMKDEQESPDNHIYLRTEPKANLQGLLNEWVEELNKKKVSFLLFYGVQGLENKYPLSYSQGHILRLSGDALGAFGEYVENVYASPSFYEQVRERLGKQMIPWSLELEKAFINKAYDEIARLVKEKIKDLT